MLIADRLEKDGYDVGPAPADIGNAPKVITIPYKPRAHFRPIHDSIKRLQCVVAHRRAGKTVALANHIIRAALSNQRKFPAPRYAYVGPSFAQAKDLVWGYFKHYLHGIDGVSFSESELTVTLPNGAKISLYGGSAAYERMRGLYMDGVVMDEFAMLDPKAWTTVIRPTLSDYRGWAIVSGTSDGDDHFHELVKRAKIEDEWDLHIIPVTETDALHPDEIEEMRKEMASNPGSFDREMMCNFDAPVAGAYYAELMNDAELEGRVTNVPYQPGLRTVAIWDLGISDYMSIWIFQKAGQEWHLVDYIQEHGKALHYYVSEIGERGYRNVAHLCPHDIRARELGTGKSRYEVLVDLGCDVYIVPNHTVEDRIDAVRNVLPICWFDREKTQEGRRALKAYRSGKSDTLGFTKPLHNWASHGADAFGHLAVGIEVVIGWSGGTNKPLRRKIRGLAR
jgi:phage terminase large subunit